MGFIRLFRALWAFQVIKRYGKLKNELGWKSFNSAGGLADLGIGQTL